MEKHGDSATGDERGALWLEEGRLDTSCEGGGERSGDESLEDEEND